MKRIRYIVMALLLLGSKMVAAQTVFDFVGSVGAVIGQIDGDGEGRYNHWGTRVSVGTSFNLMSDPYSPWRVQVEVAYIEKGSYIEYYDRDISCNYVELPLMMTYNLLDGDLRLGVGVAPAVLVGARVDDNGIRDWDYEERFRSMDAVPLLLSARYRWGEHFAIEGRFEASMVSVTDNTASGIYRIVKSNKGTFNRNIIFNICYCL